MTFSEAMDALLDGNKVRQLYWRGAGYIMLDSHDHIIDILGNIYIIDKTDLTASWEVYQPKATAGALLSYNGHQLYRVVLNKNDKLDVVNTKTWKVLIGDVYRDKLDDVIKSYGMKVINDGSID